MTTANERTADFTISTGKPMDIASNLLPSPAADLTKHVLPVIPLSPEARAALAARCDTLKTAMGKFTPAEHELLSALEPNSTSLVRGLAEEHRGLVRASTDAFVLARAALRQTMLDYAARLLETALAPIVKNRTIRRAMVRRSEPYRKAVAVFKRDERFDHLPAGELHGHAQACLELCEALLAGKPLTLDALNRKFSVG